MKVSLSSSIHFSLLFNNHEMWAATLVRVTQVVAWDA